MVRDMLDLLEACDRHPVNQETLFRQGEIVAHERSIRSEFRNG